MRRRGSGSGELPFLVLMGKKEGTERSGRGRPPGGLRGKSNLYTREKRANGEDDIGRKIFPWRKYDSSLIPFAALQVLIRVHSEAKTALKFALTKL